MDEPKMGGKRRLRLLVKGNDDLGDVVLAIRDGGRKLGQGLSDMVRETYHGEYEIEVGHESCGASATLLAELHGQGPPSHLFDWMPDVVLLSLSSDMETNPDRFKNEMREAIQLVKQKVGAHIIIVNCSSIDPANGGANAGLVTTSFSLRVHRLNLTLIELSMLEGISIVDVDRLLAELGALGRVRAAFDYSPEASSVICAELFRILADYGFFEERPLVAQLGARGMQR